MIKEAMDDINDSVTGQSTCSAESLLKTVHSTMASLDNLQIKSDRYITEKSMYCFLRSLSYSKL